MKTRKLGPFEVSEIGLGCMSLSHAYGPPPPRQQAEAALPGPLDAGCTFLATAAVYGLGPNERLLAAVLGPPRHRFLPASMRGHPRRVPRHANVHT